jgi:hypothetical protein
VRQQTFPSTNDIIRSAAAVCSRRRFLLSAALLPLCLCAFFIKSADARQAGGPRSRITTASNVLLRGEPGTKAGEVARLAFGTVVEELERSADKVRVGDFEDYWYLVAAPGGERGWVFGAFAEALDPARREEIFGRLATKRVNNAGANFWAMTEVVRFTERVLKEVTRRESAAELELARLRALGRSLANVPFEGLEKEPYASWIKEHEPLIVYSEPAGQWLVRSELLWALREKYKDLALAERIAWEAASTPLPGECEGYLPCYLYKETVTAGRYLQLYPGGAHAEAALGSITELFGYVDEDLKKTDGPPVYEVPKEDRAEFQKSVAELRAQLAPVRHRLAAGLIKKLDELARRFP